MGRARRNLGVDGPSRSVYWPNTNQMAQIGGTSPRSSSVRRKRTEDSDDVEGHRLGFSDRREIFLLNIGDNEEGAVFGDRALHALLERAGIGRSKRFFDTGSLCHRDQIRAVCICGRGRKTARCDVSVIVDDDHDEIAWPVARDGRQHA